MSKYFRGASLSLDILKIGGQNGGGEGGVRTPLPCTITTTENRFYFKISPARGLLLPLKKRGVERGGGVTAAIRVL